ncbi:YczE/YyaS/YitT family protein [Oenococcus alcoholitolerans]|uniref:YczE/YyaS/YitT family protein n=1 Tax=Oenococcus alcoholitolerans TaxID=931074 RepID=UPI003F707689
MSSEENFSKSNKSKPPRFNLLNITLKTLISAFGIILLSAGATFCRISGFGLDPFTSANLGISAKIGFSLGGYQLLVNFVFLILVFFFDRNKIGIGTVLNMFGVGFLIEIFTKLFTQLWGNDSGVWMSIGYLFIGLVLFSLGSSLYMAANLGVAPYDAIAPIAVKLTHLNYRICRVTQDIIFIIIAFFAAGPLGAASIIIAFFTGPLIVFWNKHVSYPLNKAADDFSEKPSRHSVSLGFINIAHFTYRIVAYSYDQTMTMSQQLSKFSDAEIQDRKKEANHTIENARNILSDAEKQLSMLKKEEIKRQNKEQ